MVTVQASTLVYYIYGTNTPGSMCRTRKHYSKTRVQRLSHPRSRHLPDNISIPNPNHTLRSGPQSTVHSLCRADAPGWTQPAARQLSEHPRIATVPQPLRGADAPGRTRTTARHMPEDPRITAISSELPRYRGSPSELRCHLARTSIRRNQRSPCR